MHHYLTNATQFPFTWAGPLDSSAGDRSLRTHPRVYLTITEPGSLFTICRQTPTSHSRNFSGRLFNPRQLGQRLCDDTSIENMIFS